MIDDLHGDCIASSLRYLISLLYSTGSASSSIDERVSESGSSCQWVGDEDTDGLCHRVHATFSTSFKPRNYANAWGFLSEVMENALEELRHLFIERECAYDVVIYICFCFCKASAPVLTLRLHIMICRTEERTTCMMKNKINNSTLFTKMSLILESVADDMIRMTYDECYCYCMLIKYCLATSNLSEQVRRPENRLRWPQNS